jgi:hypothetical protein
VFSITEGHTQCGEKREDVKPQQADGYNVYFSIEIKRGGGINSVPAVLQPCLFAFIGKQADVPASNNGGCSISCCGDHFFSSVFHGLDNLLNRIHFRFVNVDFTALLAHPGWNRIQSQMVTFAVNVKRGFSPLHEPFTMHALHLIFLFL